MINAVGKVFPPSFPQHHGAFMQHLGVPQIFLKTTLLQKKNKKETIVVKFYQKFEAMGGKLFSGLIPPRPAKKGLLKCEDKLRYRQYIVSSDLNEADHFKDMECICICIT